MIPVKFVEFYMFTLVGCSMLQGLYMFFHLVTSIPLYMDLIAKLKKHHPEIYDQMKVIYPHPVQSLGMPVKVDTDKFIDFLDNNNEPLEAKTQQTKLRYKKRHEYLAKLRLTFFILIGTGAASIVVLFFLVIVFNVVER